MLLNTFKEFLEKKTSLFPIHLKIWTLWDCINKNNFWSAFWRKVSTLIVFENLQAIFEKNPSLFPKNPKFLTSWELMSNAKIQVAQKTCANQRFRIFSVGFFLKRSIYFSKKTQNLNFRETWDNSNFWHAF